MPSLQIKRGLAANLPTSGMLPGEQFWTTDRNAMFVALSPTTKAPVLPPVDQLETLATIAPAADFIMVHDADAAGVKEKKMTFAAFKTALNIPAGSSDEKAAVAAGGASGYLWGSDGTDGILRLNNSLAWTKDPASAFVTLRVETLDAGTF